MTPLQTILPAMKRPASGSGAIRLRAYLVGAILVAISLYWMVWIDLVVHVGVVTKMSLAYHTLLIMLLLAGFNAVVKRFRPASALTGGELEMIYTCMFMACSIGGLDFMQMLPPTLTHPFWFASPENHYEGLFINDLPRWLMVDDPAALHDVYEGGATFYRWDVLRLWLRPGLVWCGFMSVVMLTTSCLNVLIRNRWMDGEKLSFPLTALPVSMAVSPGRFFRDKVMWIGFALALTIDLLGGLNHLYPWVPHLEIRSYRGIQIFSAMPWRAVGPIEVGANPFVVGLGFFLPLPVLFSCWFFFVFTKVQAVLCALLGTGRDRRMPYLPQQTFGAYFAIAFLTFWGARRYWRRVMACAASGGDQAQDRDEPLRYRLAVAGLVGGMVALVIFSSSAGMSVMYAIYFFLIYLAISLTLTRIRAEVGPPAHDLPYASPGEIMVGAGGPRRFLARDLTMSILYLPFTRGYRTHPMPVQLEGLKMAQECGLSQRAMFIATVGASILSTLLVFWFVVAAYYRLGAATALMRGESIGYPRNAYNVLAGWLRTTPGPDVKSLWFIAGGALLTLALTIGKTTHAWWPLYPTGFALQGGWMMRHIWIGLLVAWLAKSVIMRYGGAKLYYRARPFFFGLALGEFVMGSIWSLIAIFCGVHTWSFWS